MTNPEQDPKKILAAIHDSVETSSDILQSLKAIKGIAYAMHVDAVANIINTFRTTNTLICGKHPEVLVDIITNLQIDRAAKLVEPFFYSQFPGDDRDSIIKRHAACDEFQKNVTVLVEQRIAMEQKLHAVILPDIRKDDGHDH